MPIMNYDRRFTDMPALRKKQRCDICGAEHIGRYMFYSFYPSVSVFCRKCATKQQRALDAAPAGVESDGEKGS